eukprot:2851317-Pyramimonas_sp.AAC.1
MQNARAGDHDIDDDLLQPLQVYSDLQLVPHDNNGLSQVRLVSKQTEGVGMKPIASRQQPHRRHLRAL